MPTAKQDKYPDFEVQKQEFLEMSQRAVEIAQDRIGRGFQNIVQHHLNAWAKRFPNHTFEAMEGNGSLSFYIFPALRCCPKNVLAGHFDYIPAYARRGAIKELLEEAERLTDLYCEDFSLQMGFHTNNRLRSAKKKKK